MQWLRCKNSFYLLIFQGSLVEGTGVCSCEKLVQVDQICNADCRKNQTQTTLNKNGSMTITDPATGLIKTIDPSTQVYDSFKSFLGFLVSLVTLSVKHLTVFVKFIQWENLIAEILPMSTDQTKKFCLLLGFQ